MAGLNLDEAKRERLATARQQAAAARREVTIGPEPVIFGGQEIAVLPAELPVAVWEPLVAVRYLPLLLRKLLEASTGQGSDQAEAMGLVIDVLAAEPALPLDLVEAVREMGRRLLGEDGYAAFAGCAPSPQDVAALARFAWGKYFGGGGLGEFWRGSETASTDSTTSKPTSPASTASTPAASGEPLAGPGSSAPAGS